MNPLKEVIVSDILARVNASPFLLIVDYTGMTVPQFADLRAKLSASGAECHVVKNTFVRKAITDAGLPDISGNLAGQTAMVTGQSDICAAAKALKDFRKTTEKGAAKVGILDGQLLDEAQVDALASLPSREQLLSILLGTLLAPGTKLVRTLNEPAASLARVLAAKKDLG
jgi:large subunit ribosomal protein L10